MTKEEVIEALRRHFLPLFDPTSSVAVVVTTPSKAAEIGEQLSAVGYKVEQRTLELDPEEDGSELDSDESDESDDSR